MHRRRVIFAGGLIFVGLIILMIVSHFGFPSYVATATFYNACPYEIVVQYRGWFPETGTLHLGPAEKAHAVVYRGEAFPSNVDKVTITVRHGAMSATHTFGVAEIGLAIQRNDDRSSPLVTVVDEGGPRIELRRQ